MSGYNRHAIYAKHSLPPPPRSSELYGKGEDSGKWFKCRFCGWPCNSDRDAIGDGVGYVLKDAPIPNYYPLDNGDPLNSIIVIRTLEDAVTINENDTISEYEHNHYTQPITGCPNCGSRNWK